MWLYTHENMWVYTNLTTPLHLPLPWRQKHTWLITCNICGPVQLNRSAACSGMWRQRLVCGHAVLTLLLLMQYSAVNICRVCRQYTSHIYIHTLSTHTHTHTQTHAPHTYTHTHTQTHALHTHTHTHTHTQLHAQHTHTHTTSRKHTNTRTHIHTKMLFNWHLYRQTSYLNWTLSLVPSFAGHPVTVTRWECLFSCNTTKPHEVNSPTNHPLHYTLYMISCSSLDSTHNSSTRQQWALVMPMAIPDRLPYIVMQTNKQTNKPVV